MKFGETIPKGYILEVTSWENDGDDYDTIQKRGVSTGLVDVVTKLFPLFKSKHSRNDRTGFGNTSENEVDNWDLVEASWFALKELDKQIVYRVLGCDIMSLDFESDDDISDEVIEDIGDKLKDFVRSNITGYSEYYDFRVAEQLKVYYLSEDVIIPSVETISSLSNR